ncbi:MAG: YciI family protein [Propionibacteriales bacterium]|nr:YciI family protein [Propionibacteriales bacterium]
MRVMVIVKSDETSEMGVLPAEEYLSAMDRYNEELVRAGVLLAAEGLTSSSEGKKVRFTGSRTTVIDGPFTETKELVAGFWLLEVRSMDEAVEWVRRIPVPDDPEYGDGDVEIRVVADLDGHPSGPKLIAQGAAGDTAGA